MNGRNSEKIIEAVLLTFENQDKVKYLYLSEFLKFLGVFVGENNCQSTYKVKEEDYQYSYTVKNIDNDKNFEKLCTTFNDVDIVCIGKLYEIYKKYNLFQHSITIEWDRMNEKSGQKFIDAINAISDLIKQYPEYNDYPHVLYAKLYCKNMANLAYFYILGYPKYYVDILVSEGLELTKKFRNFANAWYLLGRIIEIAKDYVKDELDAFQRAIKMTEGKQYSAEIYYWLGRRTEEHGSLNSFKGNVFITAYSIFPHYKYGYKVANDYMQQEKWNEALKYLLESSAYIEELATFLIPYEQIYYFLIKTNICYCYLKIEDYNKAILHGKQALLEIK